MPKYCGGVPKSTNMRYDRFMLDFSISQQLVVSLIEFSNVELVCYTGFTPATLQNLLHIGIVLLGRYFIPVTNCSKLFHNVTYSYILLHIGKVLLGGCFIVAIVLWAITCCISGQYIKDNFSRQFQNIQIQNYKQTFLA